MHASQRTARPALARLPVLLATLALAAPAWSQSFCHPGDAVTSVCPCGNAPASVGQGCENSNSTGGAAMVPSGSATIGADTLVFTTTGVGTTGLSCTAPSGSVTCILVQGTASIPSVPFSDGVRCVGGTLKRLQISTSSGGTFANTVTISLASAALADPLFPGVTRRYFTWYRDPCPTFACTGAFDVANTSNAWEILWS